MSAVVLLATRNAGKLRELLPMLTTAGIRAETLAEAGIPESPDEDELESFETFEENALAKARWFSSKANGRVVFADDSGLVVAALAGRPGVHSKRWAGMVSLAGQALAGQALDGQALDDANNAYLVAELDRSAAAGRPDRSASYVCAAACAWDGGSLVVTGSTTGRIMAKPVGTGGFGYDPYFWSADLGAGFAEVSREAKQAVSHRGRAFRGLLDALGMEPQLKRKLFGPVDPEGVSG